MIRDLPVRQISAPMMAKLSAAVGHRAPQQRTGDEDPAVGSQDAPEGGVALEGGGEAVQAGNASSAQPRRNPRADLLNVPDPLGQRLAPGLRSSPPGPQHCGSADADGENPAESAVSLRTAEGEVERPIRNVTAAQVMAAVPWRTVRSVRGQSHFPGRYWSATTGGHVVCESRLELARLLVADFDTEVVGIAAQPFLLRAAVGGRARRHVPDFLLVHGDGSARLVNVKPASRLEDPLVVEALQWPGVVARSHGWACEIWNGAKAVYLANLRFLAGYHRPGLLPGALTDAVAAAFRSRNSLLRSRITINVRKVSRQDAGTVATPHRARLGPHPQRQSTTQSASSYRSKRRLLGGGAPRALQSENRRPSAAPDDGGIAPDRHRPTPPAQTGQLPRLTAIYWPTITASGHLSVIPAVGINRRGIARAKPQASDP